LTGGLQPERSEPGGASADTSRPSVSVWIGLVAVVTYLSLLFIFSKIGAVHYDALSSSEHDVFWGLIFPVGSTVICMIVLTSYLRLWRPVLFETRSSDTKGWGAIIVFVAAATVTLVGGNLGAWPPATIIMLVIGTCLVGFGEELTTRGLLLTALRRRYAEIWVWLISTGAFAVMHSVNLLSGQSPGKTLAQVAGTFCLGSVLYVSRRVSGTLFVPMALHAFWDFSVFINRGPTVGGAAAASPLASGLVFAAVTLAALFIIQLGSGQHQPRLEAPDAYLPEESLITETGA